MEITRCHVGHRQIDLVEPKHVSTPSVRCQGANAQTDQPHRSRTAWRKHYFANAGIPPIICGWQQDLIWREEFHAMQSSAVVECPDRRPTRNRIAHLQRAIEISYMHRTCEPVL